MELMNFVYHIAHSEALHSQSTGELEHLLTSLPVALPLFIVVNIAIFWLVDRWRKPLVLPAVLGANLLAGILSYEAVPVVSILGITLGITSALFITLTLLAQE
jgi:hypothetical protein